MQSKLVYVHHWGDKGCSGIEIIPFEYSRRDEFLHNIWERYKDIKWETHTRVEVLGVFLDAYDFKNLDENIYDLEDWWIKNRI